VSDLGPAFAEIAGALQPVLGPVVGTALRKLFSTVVGIACVAVVLAVFAFVRLGDVNVWLRLATLAAVLALSAGAAGMLGVKNAVNGALAEALQKARPAHHVLIAVFGAIAKLAGRSNTIGRAVAATATTAERVPLADAERWLRQAIQGLIAADGAPGFRARMARAVRAKLGEKIEDVTLARFRSDESKGVDLDVVRDELAATIDDTVRQRVASAAFKLTIVGVIALVLVCVAVVEAVHRQALT
jgi:hypothetical protein